MLCRLTIVMLLAPWIWAISAFGQTVSSETLGLTVKNHLQEALDQMDQGYFIAEVQPRADVTLPDGELTMELTLNPEGLAPGARLGVGVSLLVNGKEAALAEVFVHLKQRVGLAVPRRNLRRGDVVTADSFVIQETELTHAQGDYVTQETMGRLLGKEVNRQVREGKPVRSDWFSEPLAVTRGENIRVVVDERGLTIETMAVAEANGRVGETIQVRNAKSNRRFAVRLVGPGEGRVEIL